MIIIPHGIRPDSDEEARQMTTGLRSYYADTGVCRAQFPGYDLPLWALSAGFMPGNDRLDLAITCVDISEKLEPYHILHSSKAIHRIIQHMIHRQESIKSHRRNIGQSCVEVLRSMGGIKWIILPPNKNGFELKAYYFGRPHNEIIQKRRAFELIIKP